MKRLLLLFLSLSVTLIACCQILPEDSLSRVEKARQWNQEQLLKMQSDIRNWDIEHSLDSLDQNKLPKVVSGGLIGCANISNFMFTANHETLSSYMKAGGDIGGFIDFRVTKHFAIQGRLVFTAEQNHFGDGHSKNHLWSFGVDIPIYFLGRVGNMQKGYLQVGAGPFTHFTFASNIQNKYTNNEAVDAPSKMILAKETEDTDKYQSLYLLHDNHAGLAVTIGYEFPIGIQILANYQVSLSDIITWYKQNKGSAVADVAVYPQKVSLGIGYRWK